MFFMEKSGKLSLNYHKIPSLSFLLFFLEHSKSNISIHIALNTVSFQTISGPSHVNGLAAITETHVESSSNAM